MAKIVLTDRFVQGVKTSLIQEDFFDDNPKARGLFIRVAKTGRKSWGLLYTNPSDGKRARISFGTYPAVSLAQARTWAIEARRHLEQGRDPRDVAREEAAKSKTVEGLIDDWLSEHARATMRSHLEVERRLRKNVIPLIGSTKITDISKDSMNRVVNAVLARGARVEASRCFEDFRSIVRWAVAKGLLQMNPLDGMKKLAGSKARTRTLSPDEIKIVWDRLPIALKRSKACQRAIKLGLITGQRPGEIVGMTRGELNLDAKIWTIPEERSKNGDAHKVPLSDMAVDVIKEALADIGKTSRWLFPRKDGKGPIPVEVLDKTVARAMAPSKKHPHGRFGIAEHWRPHDLRRTVLSAFAEMGVPPIVAGAVANHKSVTKANVTLQVYTQYDYLREKREALDAWATRLAEIVG